MNAVKKGMILETNILLSTPIDKSLKKHSDHPVIRKKLERAKETLKKAQSVHLTK